LSKYYHPPHTSATNSSGHPTPTAETPYPTVKEQKAFEKGLLEKTAKSTADIILYDNHVIVFKPESDVMLYVVGGMEENEMLLYHVVLALRDTLQILLKYRFAYLNLFLISLSLTNVLVRNSTDKRTIIENYDLVSLAIEEIVDDGVVLETDPVSIVARVSRPPQHEIAGVKGLDLSEQGLLNAWEFGKKQLAERLRQGL
jgi:hypothetical protein